MILRLILWGQRDKGREVKAKWMLLRASRADSVGEKGAGVEMKESGAAYVLFKIGAAGGGAGRLVRAKQKRAKGCLKATHVSGRYGPQVDTVGAKGQGAEVKDKRAADVLFTIHVVGGRGQGAEVLAKICHIYIICAPPSSRWGAGCRVHISLPSHPYAWISRSP